ncbi:MAG TPA: DMT family transporter [Gemmatimonadales bacterium]
MTHRQATLALVLTTVLWGFTFPAIKAVFLDMSPLLSVTARFGIAGLLLASTLRGASRREIEAGLVIGALFAIGVAFQNVGLEITTPSRSAFIVALSAVLTPAVGAGILGHRVDAGVVARLLVALAGVYLLTAPGGGLSGINRGDWLTMVAAVVYAGHIVAVGHYTVGSSTARILSIQFLTTAALGVAGVLTVEPVRFQATPRLFALLACLVGSIILTFTLQLRSQRVVTASEAALIFTFEPVVAAGASYLVFGERLSAMQMLGGLVILVAVGWPGTGRKGGKMITLGGRARRDIQEP